MITGETFIPKKLNDEELIEVVNAYLDTII